MQPSRHRRLACNGKAGRAICQSWPLNMRICKSLPEIRRSLATGNKAGRRHLWALVVQVVGRQGHPVVMGLHSNPHEIQPHRIPSTTLTWPTTEGSAGRASNTAAYTHARAHTHRRAIRISICACSCNHPDDTAKHGKDRRRSRMRVVETVSTMHKGGVRPGATTGVQPPPGPLGPPSPRTLLCLSAVRAALVSATGRQKLG